MHRQRGDLPGIDWATLTSAGVALPGLAKVTVMLAASGGAKLHLPAVQRYGGCQHAPAAAAATPHRLAEVYEQICLRCHLSLPAAQQAAWRAAAMLDAKIRRSDREFAEANRSAGSWLTYARLADVVDDRDEQDFAALCKLAAGKPLASDVSALRAGWSTLRERRTRQLAAYAAGCPAPIQYASAADAVKAGATSEARSDCDQIERCVGALGEHNMYRPRASLWAVVTHAWQKTRATGAPASASRATALAAAEVHLSHALVREVNLLPLPPAFDGARFHSPAAWAVAELDAWWRRTVELVCRTLEAALEEPVAPSTRRRLLLIADWPLTSAAHASVAFLAACDRYGPLVPAKVRRGWWNAASPHDTRDRAAYACVVAAPEELAARATALVGDRPGLLTAAGTVGAGRPRKADVQALLRSVFPILPGDFTAPAPSPSPAVLRNRRARRAAMDRLADYLTGLRPYALAEELHTGRYTFVPGGRQSMATLAKLSDYLRAPLRFDLECPAGPGAGDAPVLAAVFGELSGVDVQAETFTLRPAGAHAPIVVPVSALIGIGGAGQPLPGHWGDTQDLVWAPLEDAGGADDALDDAELDELALQRRSRLHVLT